MELVIMLVSSDPLSDDDGPIQATMALAPVQRQTKAQIPLFTQAFCEIYS